MTSSSSSAALSLTLPPGGFLRGSPLQRDPPDPAHRRALCFAEENDEKQPLTSKEEEERRIAEMGRPVLGEHTKLEIIIEESYEFKVLSASPVAALLPLRLGTLPLGSHSADKRVAMGWQWCRGKARRLLAPRGLTAGLFPRQQSQGMTKGWG